LSQEYPRVYRLRATTRKGYLLAGVLMAVLGVSGIVFFSVADGLESTARSVMMICCGLFLGWGAWYFAALRRIRVILHADSIEAHGAFWSQRRRRDDFSGWRLMGDGHGPPSLRLEAKPGAGSSLTLPSSIEYDDGLDAWGRDLVNLQARERQQSLDAVLADPDLPGSSEQKLEALRAAHRTSRWLLWITIGASLWLWWYPQPYTLAILTSALLPWIGLGLVAWRPSLYRLDGRTHEVRALVLVELWLPAAMLAYRAFADVEVPDTLQLLANTGVLTAALFLITLIFVRQSRGTSAWWLILVFFLYSYGIVALANRELDDGSRRTTTTRAVATDSAPRELTLERSATSAV
jgi:hypothetical protein